MPWGRHLGGMQPGPAGGVGGTHIHNALQHYPEFHGADTWGGTQPGPAGGYPARSGRGGTLPGQEGVPCRGWGWGDQDGGYPVRTTEGVLTTRRAVCLLRSRRRTFLFLNIVYA